MSEFSTRVNSARLPNYTGKIVRLTCKIIQKNADFATVQASDGGQVTIQILRDAIINDPYIEVVGKVVDATTIKMMIVINLGNDFNLSIANDAVEFIHDPRFYTAMFSEE